MVRCKKQYTVHLDKEVIERIDELAKGFGFSRSQMIRNLIRQVLSSVGAEACTCELVLAARKRLPDC